MRFLFNERVRLVALLAVALAAVAAVSAAAAPRGPNGQITFARFNPDLGDTQVYVVNPDGQGQRLVQAPTDTAECPTWFPDGAHIATCCALPGGGALFVRAVDRQAKYVAPAVAKEDRNSAYFHERGDTLDFMRIKLNAVDNGAAELEIIQVSGHWPTGSV